MPFDVREGAEPSCFSSNMQSGWSNGAGTRTSGMDAESQTKRIGSAALESSVPEADINAGRKAARLRNIAIVPP